MSMRNLARALDTAFAPMLFLRRPEAAAAPGGHDKRKCYGQVVMNLLPPMKRHLSDARPLALMCKTMRGLI